MDLGDTSNCPVEGACCWCGRVDPSCQVETMVSRVGVACVTVCDACFETATPPSTSFVEAFDAVARHCGHLGITLDEMALIEAEQEAGRD